MNCPICHLSGGFHDTPTHAQHQVPEELIKPSGWHKPPKAARA